MVLNGAIEHELLMWTPWGYKLQYVKLVYAGESIEGQWINSQMYYMFSFLILTRRQSEIVMISYGIFMQYL